MGLWASGPALLTSCPYSPYSRAELAESTTDFQKFFTQPSSVSVVRSHVPLAHVPLRGSEFPLSGVLPLPGLPGCTTTSHRYPLPTSNFAGPVVENKNVDLGMMITLMWTPEYTHCLLILYLRLQAVGVIPSTGCGWSPRVTAPITATQTSSGALEQNFFLFGNWFFRRSPSPHQRQTYKYYAARCTTYI